MGRPSKRIREIAKSLDAAKAYTIREAIDILKKCPPVKFDQTVEISLKLGVDPRRSDQSVRGTVSLPNGTGKTMKILVFAKGDKVKEALEAGADYAGHDELLEKVNGGWTDFDAVVATPDMMREVGKLGKVLGPRGLMPTPKAGTVTTDIAKAIQELKAGKIEFKLDRHGVINNGVGKVSFESNKLEENIRAFLIAIQRAKPASAKGHYMRSLAISSTMGPGLKIDLRESDLAAKES
ncbi:50S ribosomal protein L1 [Candidatus Protochlamydia amoebophila]|jgi:large subunit ribosomal protein L1|uniref:Large ribosomal subunit protein uL1 n=1 Tax=Candidatus Protochlamydia amoebophila TaxID=362787 RepID=A0A0C1K0B1_9BACT|nr:50S ribosomal protein L1 [Candidatus Protochlamydia amoebophila]KIC72947.1 50S ribosomal protein L1 [Candidatus Protochlamydia amoebophila]